MSIIDDADRVVGIDVESSDLPLGIADTTPLSAIAARINEAARDVDEAISWAVRKAATLGAILVAAQDRVKHGEWQAWLAEHCCVSARSARRYMRLAKHWDKISHLGNQESLSDAMRAIAGPAAESEAEREEEAVSLMLDKGLNQQEVAKRLNLAATRISVLYHERVKPELLAIDWEAICNEATVKEIAVIELVDVVTCHARETQKGGWQKLAMETLNVTRSGLEAAGTIIRKGSPKLIERAKAGDIALDTGARLAKLSHAEQGAALMEMKRKRAVSAIDELRSFVNAISNARYGWQQGHGRNGEVYGVILRDGDPQDVAEIASNLEAVANWASQTARKLKGMQHVHNGQSD